MAKDKQIEAIERAMPEEYELKDKLVLDTSMLPEIKDWKVGEDYRLNEVIMTQVSSDRLMDGSIKAVFKVKSVKANGAYKKRM